MLRALHFKALQYLPDGVFIYLFYLKCTHRLLPLRNPRRFSEKITWLKIFGHMEQFGRFADKYTVREYIAERIGRGHLVPLYGVWGSFRDIPFESLPDQFVLKVTQGCGYNYICKDKSQVDYQKLKRLVDGWMSQDFYLQEREAQYKIGKPRIVCEAYLEDDSGSLRDYKFWCSQGEPKVIQVDTDRFTGHKCELLDTSWRRLPYAQAANFQVAADLAGPPVLLPEMLRIARVLSQGFPFVRVDLYMANGTVYFGELTFTPGSGIVTLDTDQGELELGKLVDIHAYAQHPNGALYPQLASGRG